MTPDRVVDSRDHITELAVRRASLRLVPTGAVAMVVRSSILDRRLPLARIPFETTLNQDMRAVAVRDDVLPEYLVHLLRAHAKGILAAARKTGGSVASLDTRPLMDYRVPLPPMTEQRRIADILDSLDALVNDLNSGLPAEIDARRKQYEHYRDRLLTFAEFAP